MKVKSGSSAKRQALKKRRLDDRLLEVLDEYWIQFSQKRRLKEVKLILTISYKNAHQRMISASITRTKGGKSLRDISLKLTRE